MGKFDGRVAIITGGGKGGGIGYGLSTAFAKEGCNLVITGRNTKKLDDAKEELERLYGVKVLACQADGGVEEQVAAVVKQAADTLGRIDFLINNAQNSASGVPLAEHTKEQFDQAIYSGLYAAFFYMKHCYPYLKETKGSVVNFASGAGLFGKPGQSSYAAAKEGIRGMTRVAATEWGPDGINCNLICPLVMTDALKKWREEYPSRPSRASPPVASATRRRTSAAPLCSCAQRMPSISPVRPSPCRAAAVCVPDTSKQRRA